MEKTLKEKCEYYRSKTDYTVSKENYILVMLDGRSFSKIIKKNFELPFDDTFIDLMNRTAAYVCKNVQGVKFAYTQSDEISLLITAFGEREDLFFGGRLVKMLSIIPGLATAYFNKNLPKDLPLIQFDAKVWEVPTQNDAFAWFLYRQNDCIRNSKLQHAQYYFSHNALKGLGQDEQVEKVLKEKGVDWNTAYDNGKKYGRLILKKEERHEGEQGEYYRTVWEAKPAVPFMEIKEEMLNLIPEKNGNGETNN